MIRKEIMNFVGIWNTHKIRAQSGIPSSQPNVLYFNLDQKQIKKDYGIVIDDEQHRNLKKIFSQPEFDAQQLLPPHISQICQHIANQHDDWIQTQQIDLKYTLKNANRPFLNLYKHLRYHLTILFQHHQLPEPLEIQHPLNGREELEQFLKNQQIPLEEISKLLNR